MERLSGLVSPIGMKKGVLILECLGAGDPGSEGQFVLHMLNLMGVPVQYITVRTKKELIRGLKSHRHYPIIHVATHGTFGSRSEKQFAGLWTTADTLKHADLISLNGRLKGCAVVSTACGSGTKEFRRVFVNTTQCSHYIAPKRSPTFATAIFFAHIFYHKHLILKRSIQKSYDEYADHYKNVSEFTIESLRSSSPQL